MDSKLYETTDRVFSDKPPIIFVHGLCHGKWCWKKYEDFFMLNYYKCHAFDLHKHGEREFLYEDEKSRNFHFGTEFDDYLDDLDKEVNAVIDKYGAKPVIIGHSMGGAIAQRYIENEERANKISDVVLLASVPKLPIDLSKNNCRLICFKYVVKMFSKLAPVFLLTVVRWKLFLSKSAFFSGSKPNRINKDELRTYIKELGKEPLRVSWRLLRLGGIFNTEPYRGNPRVHVIGSSTDKLFGKKELELTAKFYGTEAKIFDGMCHDMMLDPRYNESAEEILKFIETNHESNDKSTDKLDKIISV